MSNNRVYELETPDMSRGASYYQCDTRTYGRSVSPGKSSYDVSPTEVGDFVNIQTLPEFVRSFTTGEGSVILQRESLRTMLSTLEKTQLIEMLCQSIVQSAEVHSTIAYNISSLATFRRLLVRNIAFSSTSEEVKELLSARYGAIEEGTVVYDRATGRSKGFAFITFASVDSACSAIIDSTRGLIELSGRCLLLKFAADKVDNAIATSAPSATARIAESPCSIEEPSSHMRKLFVYNLSPLTTTESLANALCIFGPMEQCSVVTDAGGVSKRYAFVTFVAEDSAWRCLQEPNKTIDGRMTFCHLASEGPAKAPSRSSSTTPPRPMSYQPQFNSPAPTVQDDVDVLFNNILTGLMTATPEKNDTIEAVWDTCSTPEHIKTFL